MVAIGDLQGEMGNEGGERRVEVDPPVAFPYWYSQRGVFWLVHCHQGSMGRSLLL